MQLRPCTRRTCSETATTATTLPPGRVGGSGGDVLDASDAHTGTGEGAESRLGTGAGGLGAVTTSGADLDVEGRDAELLAADSYRSVSMCASHCMWLFRIRTDVLGSQHGGVGRRLVTVGLDLHATGDTRDGLATRQIGDVDEGVVERGEDAGNAKDELALADLGTQLQTCVRAVIANRKIRVLLTWMFSCAPRSTFFLGGMLAVELVTDFWGS
jgi:hypothetical protein